METIFNDIDKVCDLSVIQYSKTSGGQDYFYLLELSALQVLRELPSETSIKVTNMFSQRHLIAQKLSTFLATRTITEFLNIAIPLVDNGNFPCDDLTIILDSTIELSSHDDGEVHLSSGDTFKLRSLINKILLRQNYSSEILNETLLKSNQYLKLSRPNQVVATYDTFDELIENI